MRRFVTLMYHKIGNRPTGRYDVSVDDFRAQVAWLKRERYEIEGFAELHRRLQNHEFPERYVVVTFDDGHGSNMMAAEILREFDAQGTFFLSKNLCQTRADFLTNHEIQGLAELCSVGSHGVSHIPFSGMTTRQVRAELAESKDWLENLTGREVIAFSAPLGYMSSNVVHQAVDVGYTLLGNSKEWWNCVPQVRKTKTVNRIAVRSSFSMTTFRKAAKLDLGLFVARRVRSALLEVPKSVLSQSQIRWLRRRRDVSQR